LITAPGSRLPVPGADLRGQGAAGVLTHLGVEVGVPQHGFVLGTTIGRAIEMAQEAGLQISLVLGS
jgi:hypothetical protein